MRKTLLLLLTMSLVLASVFGQGAVEPLSGGIVYTDTYGYTTTIEANPGKVVSLAPNLTEAVFALGKGPLLVGRTDYCVAPAEAASIESVGDMYNVNIEKIVSLQPDLVICSSIVNEATASTLRGLGVPLMIVNKEYTADGSMGIITDLGYILGCEDRAAALVADIQTRIAKVRRIVSAERAVSCYYCVGFGEYGDFTATGDTYINAIIEAAGGINVASDGTNWAYSREKLIEKDPEMVIFPQYSYSSFDLDRHSFSSTEPYAALNASKSGRMYPIEAGLLDRQGVGMASAVEALARILHPALFKGPQ